MPTQGKSLQEPRSHHLALTQWRTSYHPSRVLPIMDHSLNNDRAKKNRIWGFLRRKNNQSKPHVGTSRTSTMPIHLPTKHIPDSSVSAMPKDKPIGAVPESSGPKERFSERFIPGSQLIFDEPEAIPDSTPGESAVQSPDVSIHRHPSHRDDQITTRKRPLGAEGKTSVNPARKTSKSVSGSEKIELAIDDLNKSIVRLYKISALLQGTLQPEDPSQEPDLKPLDSRTVDEGIARVATVTQQLIADNKRVKEERTAQRGLYPATERFLRTTGYVISPVLKTFLKVVVHASAVNAHFCGGLCRFQF